MEEERWITIGSYVDVRDANADADLLKARGIACKTVFHESDAVLFIEPRPGDWVFLKIPEAHFEEAADVLELEPYTIEDFEQAEARVDEPEPVAEGNTGEVLLWGGLVSLVIIIRLLLGS